MKIQYKIINVRQDVFLIYFDYNKENLCDFMYNAYNTCLDSKELNKFLFLNSIKDWIIGGHIYIIDTLNYYNIKSLPLPIIIANENNLFSKNYYNNSILTSILTEPKNYIYKNLLEDYNNVLINLDKIKIFVVFSVVDESKSNDFN